MASRSPRKQKPSQSAVSPSTPPPSVSVFQSLRQLSSTLLGRLQLARLAGLTFGAKRDLYAALGYERTLSYQHYYNRFLRGDLSRRIITMLPRAVWRGGFIVSENDQPGAETPFEQQIEQLDKRLGLAAVFTRANILAGIGDYAIILIGAEGPFDSELPRLNGPDSIAYLSVYGQDRAGIEGIIGDGKASADVNALERADPRFGQARRYSVKISDTSKQPLHYTRAIHIARGLLDDELHGEPELRSIWNKLDDLDKLTGGGSEAAWQRVDSGMQFNVDPSAPVSDDELNALEEQIEDYRHGFERYMLTRGVEIKNLSGQMPQFASDVNCILRIVAGAKSIPLRILIGSEAGEMASTQDRNNWADRVDEARTNDDEPQLRSFIDRLIAYGGLAEPSSGEYRIIWPSTDDVSPEENATLVGELAKANKANVEAGGTIIITGDEIRENYLGLSTLEEAGAVITTVEETTDSPTGLSVRPLQDLADEEVDIPEWQIVHRVADEFIQPFADGVESLWDSAADSVQNVTGAVDAIQSVISADMPDLVRENIFAVFSRAGEDLASESTRRGTLFTTLEGSPIPARESAAARLDAVNISFNTSNPRAIETAETQVGRLITEVGPATVAAVQQVIADSIEAGLTIDEQVRVIKQFIGLRTDQVQAVTNLRARLEIAEPGDVVTAGTKTITIPRSGVNKELIDRQLALYTKRLRRQRAELIARRETLFAANAGQRELWFQARDAGQLDSKVQREWIVTPDERLRDSHAAMAGQRQDLDTSFEKPDGARIEPGEEPNCRCAQGLVRG